MRLHTDLILMPFHEIGITLVMQMLIRHYKIVNSFIEEVVFELGNQQKIIFHSERQIISTCLISAIYISRLIKGGC